MKTALLLVALAACGTKSDDTSCPPLRISVDGEPLAAMPHGLARQVTRGAMTMYEVDVYDHAQTTCEDYMSKDGRPVPPKEVAARAFAGGYGPQGAGVGLESYTKTGGNISLLKQPAAVGDRVEICVRKFEFTPPKGPHKDKPVSVDGLFAGTYCGVLTPN